MKRYPTYFVAVAAVLVAFAAGFCWSHQLAKTDASEGGPVEVPDIDQDPGLYFLLAEQAEAQGDADAVVRYYRKALSLDPSSAYLYARVATLQARNRKIADALIMARMATIFDANYDEAHALLGKIYNLTGDRVRAIESYNKALELKPDEKELYVFVGSLQASQNRFAEAEKTFKKMVQQFPEEKDGYFYLGKVYVETKQYDQAVKTFEKLLEVRKEGASQVHVELGAIYAMQNKLTEAEYHFREAVKLDSFNIDARFKLGQVLATQNNFAEAYKVFDELSKLAPSNVRIRIQMALILAAQKQYDQAKEMLNKILETKPGWDQVRFHLGRILREQGKMDDAEKEFSQIPKGASTYLNSRIVMAIMYLKTRALGKAMRYADEAIETESKDPDLYQIRGSILEELGRYTEALKSYNRAIELDPNNLKLRYSIGNVCEKSGRRSEGLKVMNDILKEKPDDPSALNFVGYTLLVTGGDMQRAEVLIRKANELKPNDGYIMDSLGWALFKSGKIDEALELLKSAAEKVKVDPIIAEHYGDALMAKGMKKDALEAYRRSIEANPTNMIVREKIEKLDRELAEGAEKN